MKVSRYSGRTSRIARLALLILFVLGVQAIPWFAGLAVAEEARVEVQAEVGFGASNVKQGLLTPVKFTLLNQGADIAGDLVLQIANPNGSKDFSYVQHVELPQGSTKEIRMLVPGYTYSKSNNRISFFQNSVQSGKKISLDGSTYLEAFNMPRETMQVGVLARDADTMNFLAVLNQSGKKLNVLHLKQADIPGSALGLAGLDVLVLNDFASDTFTQEQVQAIHLWAQRGGTLILAGGAGYPKTAAPFIEAAPVTYQGTTAIQNLPELAKSGEKELTVTSPFTISQAQLAKDAEIVIAEGNIPLFARKAYGSGSIVYAAYDLSLNPLASWNGNSRLWEQILADPLQRAVDNTTNQMRFGPQPYWEMQQALEFFPNLQPPRLAILAWVMLFYAIVVGPILYFILRRMDRRELAWVVIPLLAVVTSIGIFQFGATNRGSMMAQAFHTVELDGSGSGVMQSTMSVFLPKGGNLDLKIPGTAAVRPFLQNDNYNGQQINEQSELLIRQEQEATLARLQNVPYSSVSKLHVDEEKRIQTGKLDYTVTSLSGHAAKGEITNHTQHDLTDVAVIINQVFIKIGPMKAGASASFDTSNGSGISYGPDAAHVAFPNSGMGGLDANLHQRSVLNAYLFDKTKLSGGFDPLIIGWSKDQTSILLGNGKTLPTDQLTLFAQKMKINFVSTDGKIHIPFPMLVPDLVDNHLKVSDINFHNGPYMQMGGGDVTFEYRLPSIPGANYQKMEMHADVNRDVTLDLWNTQSREWETIDVKPLMTWEGEKLQPYILEGKMIRIKATALQNNIGFRIPAISMEGAVKP
ncbi:DUF7408 domain-containing protein [Paenibacillus sedimenti]|uniref:DUF7408 domain-containing protein n=1 Tax=Paenibacillus sedimenti TaxID=2770274 RepID=A0A926QIA4_9BACL|nr:hypothetical protein [Paenibacillus sedimenti]MBD0379137.1 hypothetical protein [Paenibacillus sedimenti]